MIPGQSHVVSCESYLLGAWDMWGAPTIPGIALGHGPKVHTQDPSPSSLSFGKSWWGGQAQGSWLCPQGAGVCQPPTAGQPQHPSRLHPWSPTGPSGLGRTRDMSKVTQCVWTDPGAEQTLLGSFSHQHLNREVDALCTSPSNTVLCIKG